MRLSYLLLARDKKNMICTVNLFIDCNKKICIVNSYWPINNVEKMIKLSTQLIKFNIKNKLNRMFINQHIDIISWVKRSQTFEIKGDFKSVSLNLCSLNQSRLISQGEQVGALREIYDLLLN